MWRCLDYNVEIITFDQKPYGFCVSLQTNPPSLSYGHETTGTMGVLLSVHFQRTCFK
eukprot:NODE_3343_length_567_cov_60.193050_g2818_i0.p1 GENE.NODE_3343_length_567_cov_60.193050_g2818_i0~~NODE_3343_length_567_cov_60.193050_g2818_i0.p1  ORF type:complete len:57 (+),score=6.98 NODE_3343_length_567_cov_60.193050_g2818_i0:341-511(+)